MASHLTFALRFPRSEATKLRTMGFIADRTEDLGLFEMAAEEVENGDPWIIRAMSFDEVERIADRFVRHGIRRPAIDLVTG